MPLQRYEKKLRFASFPRVFPVKICNLTVPFLHFKIVFLSSGSFPYYSTQVAPLKQTLSPCPTDCQSAPCGIRVRSLRNNDEQEASCPSASFAFLAGFEVTVEWGVSVGWVKGQPYPSLPLSPFLQRHSQRFEWGVRGSHAIVNQNEETSQTIRLHVRHR